MTAVIENVNIVADTFKFIDGTTSSKSATFDCSSLVGDNTFVFPDGGGTFLTSGSVTVAADKITAGTGTVLISTGAAAVSMVAQDGQNVTVGNAAEDAYFRVAASATAGTEDVRIVNTNGTDEAAIQVTASAGGVDIDAAAAKNIDISGGQVAISSKDDAASAIALTTNVGTSETIVVTNTLGTGTGAITLNATAGGVDIDAAAGADVTVDGGQVLLTSADSVADAIYLHANGGTSETIRLHADQGTARSDTASSIQLTSDVGGITLNSAGLDDPAAIKLVTGDTGGIQVRAGVTSEGTDLESRRIFRLVTAADAAIQTTDATPVVLTFSLASSGTIAHYKVLAVGYNADDGAANCFNIEVEGFAVNVSGTVSRPNANTITTRGTTTATADVDVSGTNIQLTLTGIAAKTIDWVGYIEFNTTDSALARSS